MEVLSALKNVRLTERFCFENSLYAYGFVILVIHREVFVCGRRWDQVVYNVHVVGDSGKL